MMEVRNVWVARSWSGDIEFSGLSASPVKQLEYRVIAEDGKEGDWRKLAGTRLSRALLAGGVGSWIEVRLLDAAGNPGLPLRVPRLP
jgi:hypothetical protein